MVCDACISCAAAAVTVSSIITVGIVTFVAKFYCVEDVDISRAIQILKH